MFNRWRKALDYKHAKACLKAFKVVRAREGETEIFKEIDVIQSIPLFAKKTIIDKLFGYPICEKFCEGLSQKLLSELSRGLAANIMLMRYGFKSPVVLPYPHQWRSHLSNSGLKSKWYSSLVFYYHMFLKIYEGISETKKLFFYSLKQKEEIKSYIAIIGAPESTISKANLGQKFYNLLSDMREYFSKSSLIFVGTFYQKVDESVIKNTFPFLPIERKFIIYFLIKAVIKITLSTTYLLFGRWQYSYMLRDSVISSYLSFLTNQQLPRKIIFLSSHYIYRPLWADELEKRNTEVALLFYATNTYNLQFKDGEMGLIYGYQGMTWNTFYTFHQNHALFIKNVTSSAPKINVLPRPLLFIDNAKDLALPIGPKVALFDIQPFKDSFLAMIGRPTNIYTYSTSQEIIKDILRWCVENEVYLILKHKKTLDSRFSRRYEKMLKSICSKWFILLDSGFSPKRVCQQVNIVIAQPFTSAALHAVSENKPVVYYDPKTPFVSDQPASQGIPLLQNKEALYKYLSENLKKT